MVVRGGGELGSAAARLLHLCGFAVVVLERPQPLAVRRLVCFAEAVLAGSLTVEGVEGRLAGMPGKLRPKARGARGSSESGWMPDDLVPVVVDPEGQALGVLSPTVVVDARMAKANLGTRLEDAPLVIGLGPGLAAGRDVHAVVETQRGPQLGQAYWTGAAEPDTTRPAEVAGVGESRVLRAPRAGPFHARVRIGDLVTASQTVGDVAGGQVVARVAGRVRGLLAEGVRIETGTKVGDIEPRLGVDPARISDKARTVAAGVLEAVMIGLRRLPAARPQRPRAATSAQPR